jgi:hypothetical protein
MILWRSSIPKIAALLRGPEDFNMRSHRDVYIAVLALWDASPTFTFSALASEISPIVTADGLSWRDAESYIVDYQQCAAPAEVALRYALALRALADIRRSLTVGEPDVEA